MALQDKLSFTGLDTDLDNRSLEPSSYRFALNCRVGSNDKGENLGAVENVKGNKLVTFALPDRENVCVGTLEDKKNISVIYFVFNSNKNHSILQYFPDKNKIEKILKGRILNFNKDHLITGINLVDGNLLYWNEWDGIGTTDDFNPPRKINIEKANNTGKKFKLNLYWDKNKDVTFTDENGNEITIKSVFDRFGHFKLNVNNQIFEILGHTSGTDGIRDQTFSKLTKLIATNINNISALSSKFTATACGEFVEIEYNDPAEVVSPFELANLETFIQHGNGTNVSPFVDIPGIVVAQNFYPEPLDESILDRIKYPPRCEPKVSLIQDDAKQYNYIEKKVFQFRTSYIYDDNEKSTLSPISTIPFDPSSCSSHSSRSLKNGIKIDFTDTRLNDVKTLSIIKNVELFVREGNLGKFKSITKLEQNEFGIGENSFIFFNDSVSTTISDAISNKLFDSVPLLAKSQEFVKNRLFDGGTLEDYNPVCVDAKLDVKYKEEALTGLFSITGRIFIRNLFAGNNFHNSQPIHDQGKEGVVWGGFGNVDVVNNLDGDYGQRLPLRGWLVYLAGTDHRDISIQTNPTVCVTGGVGCLSTKCGDVSPNLVGTNNVYDTDKLGTAICRKNRTHKAAVRVLIEEGVVFSTFKIKNVPPGRYALRVASHFTTQDDLNDPGRGYQKTSTNTAGIFGGDGTGGRFETVIEVKDKSLNAGDINIIDLTNPKGGSGTTALTGYVTDNDNNETQWADQNQPTQAELLADTRIELAKVNFAGTISDLGAILFPFTGISEKWYDKDDPHTFTDHNGYFFYTKSKLLNIGSVATEIKDIQSNNNIITNGGSKFDLLTSPVSNFTSVSGNKGAFIVCRNTSEDVSKFSRTKLIGRVEDSDGNGIADISVISTRGDIQKTTREGDFELIVYGDTEFYVKNGENTNVQKRFDTILYSAIDITCTFSFSPEKQIYGQSPAIVLLIGDLPNYFNNLPDDDIDSLFYDLQTVEATLLSEGISNAYKRGGDWQHGIIYEDRASRTNTTNSSDDLKLHIPFYTEKDPKTGTIQPTGIPTVSWEINHKPPDFATHWQWVRTKNTSINQYLQWAINKVEYVDDQGNTSTETDGTQIKLNTENIAGYLKKFPNSQVNITPETGWRLRFIKDESRKFFDKYVDVEIIKFVDGTDIFIYQTFEINPIVEGMVIEIYDPILKVEEEKQFFFEFGECFEIGIDANGNKFHNGPTQDQDLINNKPATGTFKTGDAWYKLRNIPVESGSVSVYVDDASLSDFFPSRDQSIGRINIIDKDARQLSRPTFIRFSNKFLPGSKINGLSSFEALNGTEFPRENGLIQKLIWTGNVLLAIHEHNTISHYIQEKIYLDVNGLQVVSISDEVLDSFRILAGQNGTFNPESVTEHMGRIYWYDMYKGEAIRYSRDGLTTISDYRMKHHFAEISRKLLELDRKDTKVFGVYDAFFDEYILTFIKIPTLPVFHFHESPDPPRTVHGHIATSETIAFNEKINRWTTFYSFIAEYYVKLGLKIISFKDGKLYIHNENDVYNNFYDEQFTQKIKPVAHFNGEDSMKIWQNISIRSQHKWKVPEITNPEGQKSSLIKDDFETKEGIHHAAFLRDEKTPNISLPLLEGDTLRSQTLEILMENDETVFSKLYNIDIYAIKSERINK